MNALDIMDALTDISPHKVQSAIVRMGYADAPESRARHIGRKARVVLLAAVLALLLAACGYAVGCAINSPEQAWVVTQREIQTLKDMGVLAESIRLPDEPKYIMEIPENDGHMQDPNYWHGRIFKHSYCVMAVDSDYLFNLFVDTMTGKITKLSIEARADENDAKETTDAWGGCEISMNNHEIIPESIKLGDFCALLSEYWGFSGFKLAATVEEEFNHYSTDIPDGETLLTDYANKPYITVYFDGDQQGVPMYIELSSYQHPGGVYFTVGTNHTVG